MKKNPLGSGALDLARPFLGPTGSSGVRRTSSSIKKTLWRLADLSLDQENPLVLGWPSPRSRKPSIGARGVHQATAPSTQLVGCDGDWPACRALSVGTDERIKRKMG